MFLELVRKVGLEPTRTRHKLLRLAWLPLHHFREISFEFVINMQPMLHATTNTTTITVKIAFNILFR